MSRYAVFIDGGYLRAILAKFGEPRIAYRKLSEHFAQGEERLRTYYYDCAPFQSNPPTPQERERKRKFDRFLNSLETNVPRFQSRLGRLQRIQQADGSYKFVQKKVDVLLTVDLVRLSCEKQIQRAVIVAGDSDFVPAIQVARDAGVIVQLYHGPSPMPHTELLKAADDRFVIGDEFLKQVSE